jgi:hypothetical protein
MMLALLALAVYADRFWDTYRGRGAEISTYRTVQPRYGEARDASTVMIFVPEHISMKSRIKVEDYNSVPKEDQVQVIKLNRVLKFKTGIYDYSVMTSVFSAMQPELGREEFYPLKISISASEWCGNFYGHLLPDGMGAKRVMHSYFQGEGDVNDYLRAPLYDLYEDDLPILIREFNGPFLKGGEKRNFSILPSLWQSRITHKPLSYKPGWVSKADGGKIRAGGSDHDSFKWTWQVGARNVQYWVQKQYPHYILKWETSEGEKGELTKTRHLPYWDLKSNKNLVLRKELGIAG